MKTFSICLCASVILPWKLGSWTSLAFKNFRGMDMSRWDNADFYQTINLSQSTHTPPTHIRAKGTPQKHQCCVPFPFKLTDNFP